MKRLLGLYREKQYSPGRHQSNDVLLLDQIAHRLREREFAVDLMTLGGSKRASLGRGDRFLDVPGQIGARGSGGMGTRRRSHHQQPARRAEHASRSPARLDVRSQRLVPANPFGQHPRPGRSSFARSRERDLAETRRCSRRPSPRTCNGSIRGSGSMPAWRNSRGAASRWPRCRRIARAMRSNSTASLDGFFHWFYSGEAQKYPFSFAQLETLARQAAAAAGLDIFGGDVIVSPAGELTLIDLNDWPSFAPCRERASYAIADFITRRVHAA